MAQIGQIIDGRYRITGLISEGGMSTVYRAADDSLGKEWAVKEIPAVKNGQKNTLATEAAMREADIIKSLDHHHIVRIVDIIREDHALFIVEDLIKGISLGEMVRKGHAFTQSELLGWALQLCCVLEYLHTRFPKIIYRDLKPDNIIVTDTGDIKLVDFGTARRFIPGRKQDTRPLGTVQFAAPEQYEDYGGQSDEKTDIFGLGCTLEYLAGFCTDITPEFRKIIIKCTRHDPGDRFCCTGELMKSLSELSGNDRIPGSADREARDCSGRIISVAAMLIMVAALAISPLITPETGYVQEKGGIREYEMNELMDELYDRAVHLSSNTEKGDEIKRKLLDMIEKTYITVRQINEEDEEWEKTD